VVEKARQAPARYWATDCGLPHGGVTAVADRTHGAWRAVVAHGWRLVAFVVDEMGDCSPATCRPRFLTFDNLSGRRSTTIRSQRRNDL
jgi:hypothetical protein